MADLGLGVLGGVAKDTIRPILNYILWGVILAIVGFIVYKWYTDKKIYKNPVRVYRQRENGTTKEFNTKGGYIVDKKGIVNFWIKLSRFKRQKMPSLPDPDAIDNEDRIHYYQISPREYIQTRAEFKYSPTFIKNPNFEEPSEERAEAIIKSWAEELKVRDPTLIDEDAIDEANKIYEEWVEKNKGTWVENKVLQLKPMDQQSKLHILNEITLAKQVLGVDVNKQFLYFIGGVIALVILGIVIFYIATNEGRLPLLELVPLTLWNKRK